MPKRIRKGRFFGPQTFVWLCGTMGLRGNLNHPYYKETTPKMSDILGGIIHYRCAFDATCVNKAWDDSYPDVIKRVRTWAEDTLDVPRDTLKIKEFLSGGTFKEECPPRTSFETLIRNYNTKGLAPTYWGCRLSHPCSDFSYRRWNHDITITCHAPNVYRIVVVSMHSIVGYIGEEPESPPPSVPGIVQSLISSRHWECKSGDVVLSDRAIPVFTSHLSMIKEAILSKTRMCPVVYISLAQDTGTPLVREDEMAKHLLGAAKVYVAESTDADPEMEKMLGDFATWNGGVRVYQPKVVLGSEFDRKRHRFFSPYDIHHFTPYEVTMQIVRACCRRAQVFTPNDATSIEAIVSIARRRRLHEMANNANKDADTELIELAQDLEKQLEDRDKQIKTLQDEIEQVRSEHEMDLEAIQKVLDQRLRK